MRIENRGDLQVLVSPQRAPMHEQILPARKRKPRSHNKMVNIKQRPVSKSPKRVLVTAVPRHAKVSMRAAADDVPTVSHMNVYAYIPNLIGYARVLMTIAGVYLCLNAFRHKTNDWKIGLALYTSSFILDFFDGYAARTFKQSSNFGAVLDMVTDRVSTMLLLVLLCQLYPTRFEAFAGLAALDYSSHWVQMYAAKGHHKTSNEDKNIIVRTFYGVYPFFGFCCVGTEIFYVAMVADYFVDNEILTFFLVPLFVACVSKNIVNVAQLCSGFESVAKRDAAGDKD